jgi:mycothiol synthase
MQVEIVDRLDAEQLSEVMALVEEATRADGVAPLSEQVLLAARDSLPEGAAAPSGNSAPHFLAYDGTQLAGYAHLERGAGAKIAGDATAELVVDPGHRRRGVGTTLIQALESALRSGNLRLWSHGHLDAARALAGRDGFSNVRELWMMSRSLQPDAGPLPQVNLPEGFNTRHFVVGQDEDAWLHVNARAFASHPEQGQMTRLDLDARIAQPWFDATGFILIEDTRRATPVLAASHWTKVAEAGDKKVRTARGEVYVVGVDPAYQGLGLGRAVTVLGLEHLLERDLTEAFLYVDADNTAAVRTYSRLGFTRSAVDVMYFRVVHPPVSR